MSKKTNCALEDAVMMVYSLVRTHSWDWSIRHIAHVTGWSVGKLEAAIDQKYHDWCAFYGYDYT